MKGVFWKAGVILEQRTFDISRNFFLAQGLGAEWDSLRRRGMTGFISLTGVFQATVLDPR